MMLATFNGNPSATKICWNNPTIVSEESKLISIYDELSCFVRRIPEHNVLIIGGDMNAEIGKTKIQATQLVKKK